MNVLFLTRKFPPSVGGMERYASDLHDSISENANVTLVKWGGSNKLFPLIAPFFFIKSVLYLLTKNIEIIHIQDGLLSPLGLTLSKVFRKPFVVVIHGLDITYENKIYQMVIPFCLRRANKIICISNAAREQVISRGVNSSKVDFVPLGITDDLFVNNKVKAKNTIENRYRLNAKTKKILSVGRLVERKGIHWFIDQAMPKLLDKDPEIALFISGSGETLPIIEKVIESNGLCEKVFMLGRVPNDELLDLYNGCDLFVMPNISVKNDMEGFGRVLLEAASCQMPVVATGIEGIVDAIKHEKNGILLEEKDTESFVDSILHFLDEKNGIPFGAKARAYSLENYNWDIIGSKVVEIYQQNFRP